VEQNQFTEIIFPIRLSTTAETAIRRAKLPATIRIIGADRSARADQQAELSEDARNARIACPRESWLRQKQLAELQPSTTVLILRELRENRRLTRLQYRGNYLDLGPETGPGFPNAFHRFPGDRIVDRMALAEWLMDEANPLTARVQVNRYWESLFGRGLVATSEE
jgi:hypothetical protein